LLVEIDELREGDPALERARPPDASLELLAELLHQALHDQALAGSQRAPLAVGRRRRSSDHRTYIVFSLHGGHWPHDSIDRKRE
jgi:hypothetical protein